MKIKDGIVVSKADLIEWKRILENEIKNSTQIERICIEATFKTIDKIILESQPIEPIIRNAYFKEDTLFQLTEGDFNDYINEIEI